MAGQKMRLNVAAHLGVEPAGKFLICVDEGAFVQDLATKIRRALSKSGVEADLVRLDNSQNSHLPDEEAVGDVLRDGEEVFAVLRPKRPVKKAEAVEAGSLEALLAVDEADCGTCDDEEAEDERYRPLPGPVTAFVADMHEAAADGEDLRQGFPHAKGVGDWEVSELTPKLREFIATRFQEVHGNLAEPGNTYIAVTMRPRDPQRGHTVHFSIARIDVIEFERICARKVEETRMRADFFNRCLEALESLLDGGAAPEDYAPNMLPYRYRAEEEFDELLEEAENLAFGQVEGARPVIICDTSGAVGEAVHFIRAALKRILYSFLVSKSRFNFMKFSSQGRAVAFDAEMAAPTAQRLREAEEWLDMLRPVPSAGRWGAGPDLLDALSLAVTAREVDVVYIITSGISPRLDGDRILDELRARNLRNIPIHVIGVDCDCKAEVDLRRMAVDSQGSFRAKRFDGPGPKMETRRMPVRPRADEGRMSIGGQADILDIMLKEEEQQTQDWLEEQKCANQLLLATATQQPVPDARQARAAAVHLAQGLASRPRLQDFAPSAEPARPGAAAAARGGLPRRGHAQPAQRGRAGACEGSVRRPSVANPWDKPYLNAVTGVVRVSQLRAATEAVASGIPGKVGAPTGHGGVMPMGTQSRRAFR